MRPRLQKSQRCTSCASDMVPTDRETPRAASHECFAPCVNYFTQSAQIRHAIVRSFFGTDSACAECAETADLVFHAGRLEVRFLGEPACAFRVGSCGGRLDSEHLRESIDSQGFLQCRDCKKCSFFTARRPPFNSRSRLTLAVVLR